MDKDFAGLPDHMQVIVAGTVMIVASTWGVIKFIKPFIDQLTPKPTTRTTDAVVLSADIADGKALSMLRHSVDRLNETQEKSNIIMGMLYETLVKITIKM